MAKHVELWNCDDVGVWLQKIGLAKYVETFRYNEVDGIVLLTINEDDLQSYPLMMTKFGEIRKFRLHLEKLKFDECATFMKHTMKLETDFVGEQSVENKVSVGGVKGETFDQSQSQEPPSVFMTSVDQNDESSKFDHIQSKFAPDAIKGLDDEFDGSDFAPKEESENTPKQDPDGDEYDYSAQDTSFDFGVPVFKQSSNVQFMFTKTANSANFQSPVSDRKQNRDSDSLTSKKTKSVGFANSDVLSQNAGENAHMVQKLDGQIVAKSDDQRPKETETEEMDDGTRQNISSVDSSGSPVLAANEITSMLREAISSKSLPYTRVIPKYEGFPFKNNELVCVTHIDSPARLFVMSQDNRKKALRDREMLQDIYNTEKMKSTTVKRKKLQLGQICVARYGLDNLLYRAEVLEVQEDGVKVFFVDFGNEEVVPFTEIRPLLKLFKYPPLAAECRLEGVPNPEREFAEEIMAKVESFLMPWSKLWTAKFDSGKVEFFNQARCSVQKQILSILGC